MKMQFVKNDFFYVKWFDFIIILAFAIVIVFAFNNAYQKKGGVPKVIIQTPYAEYVYPLTKDAQYKIEGVLGISYITVKDKKVKFTDSPCPNKTCVQSSAISCNGEWAACLPNNIFIRIEGQQESIDAISN